MMTFESKCKKALSIAAVFLTTACLTSAQSGSGSSSGGGGFTSAIMENSQQVGSISGYYTYQTVSCGQANGQNQSFVEYFYYPVQWQLTSGNASGNSGTFPTQNQSQIAFFNQSTGPQCPRGGYQGGNSSIAYGSTISCTVPGSKATQDPNAGVTVTDVQYVGSTPTFAPYFMDPDCS